MRAYFHWRDFNQYTKIAKGGAIKMRVLVIIPAYNEEENIKRVVDNLITYYPQYDYVIIDDGSKDKTLDICRENGYNYISHDINLGIGGSVQTGYYYAKEFGYDIAVQMDGDGQHDPKYIKDLIAPIEEGKADIVIGSRFLNGEGFQSSSLRRFGINFLSGLIRVCCGKKIKDVTSGFRAVNRTIIEFYANNYEQDYPEPSAIIAGVLHHAKIQEVPVVMHERSGGKSSINPWRSFYYMLKVSLSILLFRITFVEGG
jgi:glycosyltransferase involved in cell wall biosynthesis